VVRVPDSLGGVPFHTIANLEITPDGQTARQPVFQDMSLPLTQEDFPRLMEDITRSVHAQLGPKADRPD